MGRTVSRRTSSAPEPVSAVTVTSKAIAALTLKAESNAALARHDVLKGELMTYLSEHGEEDERGHREFRFTNPITIGGAAFVGIKRERRVSLGLDEDKASEILAEKGEDIVRRVFKEVTTTVLDQDEIYVLHQEGVLSEADIDSMFVEKETFAFKPFKE